MDEPSLDLQRILAALAEHEVRYVLIGGIAVVLHGSDRTTFDLDVVYARDPENLARVAAAIKPLRPKLRTRDGDIPFLWDARTLQAGLNFTLFTDAGWLDLLGKRRGSHLSPNCGFAPVSRSYMALRPASRRSRTCSQ